MTRTLSILLLMLIGACAPMKSGNFNKRKYLNLKATDETHVSAAEFSSDNDLTFSSGNNEKQILYYYPSQTNPETGLTDGEDLTLNTENYSEVYLEIPSEIIESEAEPDDSITMSGENRRLAMIKDELKIIEPQSKWANRLFIISLLFLAGLVALFFVLDIATPLWELLFVLLIFYGLFTAVGTVSAFRTFFATKRLDKLTQKDEEKAMSAKKRKNMAILLIFYIALPLLGLGGLIVMNNL